MNPLNLNLFPVYDETETEVREAYGALWTYSDYYDCWKSDAAEGPQVRCRCGEGAFYIQYGGYECIAVCLYCGHDQVVYDG